MTDKPVSETRLRALGIVRDNPGVTPSEFAHLLWPDHPGWRRNSRSGQYGSSMGGGMNLAGGGYLGKLKKAGLVRPHVDAQNRFGYVLTLEGSELVGEPGGEQPT